MAAYLGAQVALDCSLPERASQLFLEAADHHGEAKDLTGEAQAIIGLAAASVKAGRHMQALNLLTALHDRIATGYAGHLSGPFVALEVTLRGAVVEYLATGTRLTVMPPLPNEASSPEWRRLAEVATALHQPEIDRSLLHGFAASTMVYKPPVDRPLHSRLGLEPAKRTEIELVDRRMREFTTEVLPPHSRRGPWSPRT
jgi:hypothetical protein